MVLHQPGDQARVVSRQALFQAESFRVYCAELRVITTAALGDVMEQRGEIGDFEFRQLLHDRRQLRQFVIVLGQRQPAQIAQYEQRVRVHGVGMEQVVLHAADDATKRGDIAAQHSVGVHAPQLVRHPGRRTQDFEEQAMVARVLAEFLVDQPQIFVDRPDGGSAYAFHVRILLQHHEQLEQRGRRAREQFFVHRFQVVIAHLESRRQRTRRCGLGEDGFTEQLQQQFVEQDDVHDRAVVTLHELLDRQRVRGIFVTEALRETDLVIEQQSVLAPAGEHVQAEAHFPEERLRLLELAQLGGRQEAMRQEFVQRTRAEVALGHPGDGLDVA